jgi:hypothetical protein
MKIVSSIAVSGVLGLGVLLACGGSTAPSNSSGCDEVYTGYIARCTEAGFPASEVSRLQPRWDQYCEALIALPGSNFGAGLEACARALQGYACNMPSPPAACTGFQTGTLAAGTACTTGNQCQSGSCTITVSSGSDAGASSFCGKCDAAIPDGQTCGMQGTTCLSQSTCDFMTMKCVANASGAGAPGTPCTSASECQSGLCFGGGSGDGGTTQTCQAVGTTVGAPCPAGACSGGLVCVSGACAMPSYVAAGQPCSLSGTSQCTTGFCTPGADAGSSGACPMVIADGQPCSNTSGSGTTCDTYAACLGGVCTIMPPACM